MKQALIDVLNERERQDKKWGVQDHPLEWWYAILGEENGELAEALLETHFDNGPSARVKGGTANIRKEAVQVAAVALAMIEAIDRAQAISGERTEARINGKEPFIRGQHTTSIPHCSSCQDHAHPTSIDCAVCKDGSHWRPIQ